MTKVEKKATIAKVYSVIIEGVEIEIFIYFSLKVYDTPYIVKNQFVPPYTSSFAKQYGDLFIWRIQTIFSLRE